MSYTGGPITLDHGYHGFEIASGDLLARVSPGDYLEINGSIGTVATIDSSTTGTLVNPWGGDSVVDEADYLFGSTKADAALQLVFDDGLTDSDPGAGAVRFNALVADAITAVYISEEDRFGNNIEAWLNGLDTSDSDEKGRIRFISADAPSRWCELGITSDVADDTGYKKFSVVKIIGTAQFDDDEVLSVFFMPAGIKGQNGSDGAPGSNGTNGSDGAPGEDGVTSAVRMLFNTNTTESDPTNGKLKFDSSTLSLVTKVFIDNLDGLGSDITAWIDSMDDVAAEIRGSLRIVLTGDQTNWIEFLINGDIIDGVGYRKIPVTYVDHGGSFSLDDEIAIAFARAGKDGSTGAAGTNGNDGTNGADGTNGTNGTDGVTPATQMVFSTDVNDTDPTAGFFKFNHNIYSSVSLIFMDVLDFFTSSIVNWIDSFDDSTSDVKGIIRLTRVDDPSSWAIYHVIGDVVAGATDYRKIPVQYVASNGTFDDLMVFAITFTPKGDAGQDGINGTNGSNGQDFDITSLSASTTDELVVETGSKLFSVEEGKLWSLGQRLRAASDDGTKVMEGVLTAYSGGSATILVDLVIGSGTHSDWNISICGEPGTVGEAGTDGFQSGVKFQFSDNTTDDDPGVGFFRFDDVDPELVTKLWIDPFDKNGSDVTAWIARLAASTTSDDRGSITFEVFENPESYIILRVIGGIVDKTGYFEVPVEYVAASDTFVDESTIILNFARTGDKGLDGSGAGDVIGPDGGVTDGHAVLWDTTTGKLIKSAGYVPLSNSYLDTDGTLAANSDGKLATQKATKTYVDNATSTLQVRTRCRVATTANITIASDLNAGDSIDGVTLSSGDLVLVKDQSAPAENGIYVAGASPARFSQFDTFNEHPGTLVTVQEGTANEDTLWLCTTNVGGTIGVSDIVFSQLTVTGSLLIANNLSDLADASAARTNLSLVPGTHVQAYDADLAALAALNSTAGMLSRTGADAFAVRTLTAPAAGITISNGTGASGNPTWALANDLAALEGLSSTGFAVRTTTDTWAQRSIAGTSNEISVANGDGVSGSPTLSLSSTLALRSKVVQVQDTNFTISDNSDSTKLLAFELSSVSTATTRTLTVPNASGTIALTSDLTSGYQPLDGDLTALAALATTGLVARTASNTYATRTLTAPAAGVTVTNGDGVSGNPTIGLANDLAALEGLASTGLAVRTAADTWAQRSIAGSNGITISNGNGVSGNPTISLDSSSTGGTLGGITFRGWDAADTDIAAVVGGVSDAGSLIQAAASAHLTFALKENGNDDAFNWISGSGNWNTDSTYDRLLMNLTSVGDLSVYGSISEGGTSLASKYQALDADLTAIAALGSTGFAARTAANTWAQRTITSPNAGLTTTNGDGVSGNVAINPSDDLAAIEALASTGLAARTASNTWAQRSIAGTTNSITITNGDGVSGNPTVDFSATIDIIGHVLKVNDSGLTVVDGTDNTKIMQFQLSGITTATTRTLTMPNASGTIALTSDLTSGYQPLDADLTAVAALGSTGFAVRTAANTWAQRTITSPNAGLTTTNGDGVSGNVSINPSEDLAALEALASTGLAVRTASNTWAQRTITGTANEIEVVNGNGVSGNPVLQFPTTVDFTTNTVKARDSVFFLQDNSDTTKQLQFQLSGITTATTRTLTVPNASGTIALLSDVTEATPAGTIVAYGGTAAPTGWLLCYGQNISRTTYATLFAAIGTTYGAGDGSTTFAVPDLRGRVIAGQDDMGGTSANRLTDAYTGGLNGDTLGDTGGLEYHALIEAQLAAHDHDVNPATTSSGWTTADHGHNFTASRRSDITAGGAQTVVTSFEDNNAGSHSKNTAGADTDHAHFTDIGNTTSTSVGSGTGHNNVQPTIILNYIIYTG